MANGSKGRRRLYDAADRRALPVGVAVFVIAAAIFLASGLGWWSLLTAFAFGCAALSFSASRARLHARRRDRETR